MDPESVALPMDGSAPLWRDGPLPGVCTSGRRRRLWHPAGECEAVLTPYAKIKVALDRNMASLPAAVVLFVAFYFTIFE